MKKNFNSEWIFYGDFFVRFFGVIKISSEDIGADNNIEDVNGEFVGEIGA